MNIRTSAPSGGGTLGNAVTDTFLAVKKLDSISATRIIQDSTNAVTQVIRNPGDAGYAGGMVFATAQSA